MKTCFKCKKEKPIEEFYKHPQMGDGHLGKCKECAKTDVRENYAEKREKYSEYEKQRNKNKERLANKKKYQKQRRERNPEKERARRVTRWAIDSGKIPRQPCEVCGNEKAQAHHEDYSKPLDIMWLCFRHHRERHGQVVVSKYI